jgi:hypothetical protein
MGQYIAHRKNYKPRKEAPPIVFNEAAAQREREGWDTIQKVRELELKDKLARMAERRILRDVANAPERGTVEFLRQRKELKEHIAKWTKFSKRFFPWHLCNVHARAYQRDGVEITRHYALATLWARWVIEGPVLFELEGLSKDISEATRELPIPTHRRDLRNVFRLYREALHWLGYELTPATDKTDIRRLLRLRQKIIAHFELVENTHYWVSAATGQVWVEH